MSTVYQIIIAVAAIAAIGGLSWWLACIQTNREFGRRDRADKAAREVSKKVWDVRRAYSGKHVPGTLATALTEAWETYRSLSEGSFYIRNEAGVQRAEARARAALQAITDAVEHKLTVEEVDAEMAAVHEAITEAEQACANGVAEADTDYERALVALAKERDGQKQSHIDNLARCKKRLEAELSELQQLRTEAGASETSTERG